MLSYNPIFYKKLTKSLVFQLFAFINKENLMPIVKIIILVNLLLIAFCSGKVIATATPLMTDEETVLSINFSGSVIVSEPAKIKELHLNYSFYPKITQYQDIINFETNPHSEQHPGYILFTWNNPQSLNNYLIISKVRSRKNQPKVISKIPFPYEVPPELKKYIAPTQEIDSNNTEVIALANSLASNSSDLFEVVFLFANWTENNIEYNLSTLTADISQRSSWVLRNREGVCDELTNLFIALCRARGIAARFVSGIAYSDLPIFKNNFGPHAWAEVYFPDVGWVPFDIAYKEFGYVDSTHITMYRGVDSAGSTSEAFWKSRGVINVSITKPKFDVSIAGITRSSEDSFSLRLYPLKEKTGPGSLNAIVLDIKNLKGYYQIANVFFVPTTALEYINSYNKYIMLRPFETKRVVLYLKTPEDIKKNFIYRFPVQAIISNSINLTTYFNISAGYPSYTKKELRVKNNKVNTAEVFDFYCYAPYKEVIGRFSKITCITKNKQAQLLNLTICFSGRCKNLSLEENEQKATYFQMNFSSAGLKTITITADNGTFKKTSTFEVEVLDSPHIEIEELEYPLHLKYGERFNISFILNTTSYLRPSNVIIMLNSGFSNRKFYIGRPSRLEHITIAMDSRNLDSKVNKIKIMVLYYDSNGVQHVARKEAFIEFRDLTIFQRIMMFCVKLGNKIMALIG